MGSRDPLRGGAAEVLAARILQGKGASPQRSGSSLNALALVPPLASARGRGRETAASTASQPPSKYDALRQKLAEANEKAARGGEAIQALKKSKEDQSRDKLLRLHREVWLAEWARLEEERLRVESALTGMRNSWLGLGADDQEDACAADGDTASSVASDESEEPRNLQSGAESPVSGRGSPQTPEMPSPMFIEAGMEALSDADSGAARARLVQMRTALASSLDMSLDASQTARAVPQPGVRDADELRDDIVLVQGGHRLSAEPTKAPPVSQELSQSSGTAHDEEPHTLPLAALAREIDHELDETEERIAIIEDGPLSMRDLVRNFAGHGMDAQSAKHIREKHQGLICENEDAVRDLHTEAAALVREIRSLDEYVSHLEAAVGTEGDVELEAAAPFRAGSARMAPASPIPAPPRGTKRASASRTTGSSRRASAVRDLPSLPSAGDSRFSVPRLVLEDLEECSDSNLAAEVKGRYEELEREHRGRLQDLEESHRAVTQDRFGGWSEEEFERYVHITSQYAHSRPMSAVMRGMTVKQLAEDRLLMELPHRSRLDLIQFERWYDANKFFREKREELVVTYQRERESLTQQVRHALEDARAMHAHRLAAKEEEEALTAVRIQLMEKLLRLRQEKLDALAEASAREQQRNAQLDAWQKREHERQKQARIAVQREIQMYREQKQSLEAEKQRRIELQRQEQEEEEKRIAAINEERVLFRREEDEKKKERRLDDLRRIELEEEERERRLQALVDTVRVEAEADPNRLVGHTKSSKAAEELGRFEKERIQAMEGEIKRFQQTTFSDEKVTGDRRYRLEKALRSAGYGDSEYARSLLKNVQPSRPARKDMGSTLFNPSGGFV